MKNRRHRPSEQEPFLSPIDIVIKEINSMETSASPEERMRSTEKSRHGHTRPPIMTTSQHRSSQSLGRHGHSSSTSGAIDLQSLMGQSGSSLSSISGITVPIRLDALSYLLNSAVIGAYKTPTQMPHNQPMYPASPYMQVGCPFGACMNSSSCNMPHMNQFSACKPGVMPHGTQHGVQACQNPVPNFNQCMGGLAPNQSQPLFSSIPPQSGTSFNTSAMNKTFSMPDKSGKFPSASSMRSQKLNDVYRNAKGNLSSTKHEKLGRGDFGDRSQQGNIIGQERRFGDRSWMNMNSEGRKRFQDSSDRFQDRGNSFKRGRWQDARDGDNQEGRQQKNRENFSPPWSKAGIPQDRFKRSKEEKGIAETEECKVQDEDWEMDYAKEPASPKIYDQSPSSSLPPSPKNCDSPQTSKPLGNDNKDEELSVNEFSSSPAQEKEEGEWDSCSDKEIEIKPQVEDKDPALRSVGNSVENTVEVIEDVEVEEVYTCVIDEDDKEIMVAVEPEDQ